MKNEGLRKPFKKLVCHAFKHTNDISNYKKCCLALSRSLSLYLSLSLSLSLYQSISRPFQKTSEIRLKKLVCHTFKNTNENFSYGIYIFLLFVGMYFIFFWSQVIMSCSGFFVIFFSFYFFCKSIKLYFIVLLILLMGTIASTLLSI